MGKVNRLPKGLMHYETGYVINKQINGEIIYRRLGKITESEAIKEFSKIVTAALTGTIESKEAGSLTVYDVLEHYWNKHLCNIKSGKDARFHIPILDRFIGNMKALKLKKFDIERFIMLRSREKSNTKKPISKRTIQASLQILNMAMNRAVDDELLPRNPVARFCKVSVPRVRKIVLDHGQEFGVEWIRLYRNLPEQWRLFFLIAYETGMRPDEVSRLEREWIRPIDENLLITIPQNTEKTEHSDRRIPVSKILQKRLEAFIRNKSGKLFQSWDYFKAFRKAVDAAGLPEEITAYALRRTRATIWDSIDSSAARVALGHAPLDPHEESYVVITNERLFKLVSITLKAKIKLLKFA